MNYENYHRRSGAVRHVENGADGAERDSADHERVRRHLAPIR